MREEEKEEVAFDFSVFVQVDCNMKTCRILSSGI
jgi:hypothetical protein